MKKSKKRGTPIYWLFLLPSLLGMLVFYCIPFLLSFYYALINNMAEKRFIGLRNFADSLTNDLFQKASLNTLIFIGISVPAGMAVALLLAISLQKMGRGKALASIVLLVPLIVPSGTIVYFWQTLFANNGLINRTLYQLGFSYSDWSQSRWVMGILVVVFLWKNVSYNIVLFWSGLNWIPKTYYEQMELEGAGGWQRFKKITWVYLSPTTFVVLLMSIVNSFKVFKEVYMLYGGYPSTHIYMLQHYMNNQFLSLNMQKLTTAAYIMFLAIGIVLVFLFQIQKKLTDAYQ